ncbi:MAG: citramalate synthase, partial [Alphaproteobacteria bacterium]
MFKVKLYDTTLRDGSQTEGISYTVNDKIRIAQKLTQLGVHYIEGGWPGSNPKDMEFFQKIKKKRLKGSRIVAFGSTRRAHQKAGRDYNVRMLLKAETAAVTIFGKSWPLHVSKVLRASLDENLKMIEETIAYLKRRRPEVIYDAEHFFDGYKQDPDYALKTLLVAQDAGADAIVLCDTNGGTLVSEVEEAIRRVKPLIRVSLGIHAHNDSGLGVANSVAAVQQGCSHVQGTVNGYGERCGNADLVTIIPILKLKLNIDCIAAKRLSMLTEISRYVSEISNMKQQNNQPFVGWSAFAHKGGVHINAVTK